MYYTKAMCEALFGRAVVTPKDKGIIKSDLDVTAFTYQDFLRYWREKAKLRDVKYVAVKFKDKAILTSLMKNYSNSEIQLMIDYLWESGELVGNLHYADYGIFLLSNNWVNSIYNRARHWKMNYKDKDNRGWENKVGETRAEIEF